MYSVTKLTYVDGTIEDVLPLVNVFRNLTTVKKACEEDARDDEEAEIVEVRWNVGSPRDYIARVYVNSDCLLCEYIVQEVSIIED